RAVGVRRDALARTARLTPSPQLVARIGQRPDAPTDRRAWDAAAGAVAVCAELHDVPDHDARALRLPDAARVGSIVRRAEITYLARRPTSDLADEISTLTDDLTTGGRASLIRRIKVSAALARADLAIDNAQARKMEVELPNDIQLATTTSTRRGH